MLLLVPRVGSLRTDASSGCGFNTKGARKSGERWTSIEREEFISAVCWGFLTTLVWYLLVLLFLAHSAANMISMRATDGDNSYHILLIAIMSRFEKGTGVTPT